MQISQKQCASKQVKGAFRPCKPHRPSSVACQSHSNRRDVLLTGAALAASPLIIVKGARATEYIEVEYLSTFQKNDQRQEFVARAQGVLREALTAADAPACVRLALHDAGTYDIATKTGGFDGSIALNDEELSRPENSSLSDIVGKLRKAKEAIDAGDKTGSGPISWADTIYLAGRVSSLKAFEDYKISRAATSSGGRTIAVQFRNPFDIQIGRVDSSEPGTQRVPALDADVESIRQYFLKLGAKPGSGGGPFAPKPPFWERPAWLLWTAAALDPEAEEKRFVDAIPGVYKDIKKSYDISRRTVTRTDYEVDFAEYYNKMCGLGAKFDKTKYLYKIPVTNKLS